MRFDRLLASLTLFLVLTSPLFAGTTPELIPAPEIELEVVEPRSVEDILNELKRKIRKERPSNSRVVYEWFKSAGNAIGIGGDVITATYTVALTDMPQKLSKSLEHFGLAFALTTCLEKQFVSGEPAGMDAAYETAKYLAGTLSGGGAAAAGIIKYSLDTFGNAAMAQIDSDFYNAYSNWQLEKHSDFNYYFDLYAKPNGGQEVDRELDLFWISEQAGGMRGIGMLMTKYKGELDEVKKAYRQKFSKDYIFPAMRNIWEDKMIDAEVALLLQAQTIRSAGKNKKKIRIAIKKIIDRGTAKGAKDLKAILTYNNKYIVAQTEVNGSGAVFEFPAGKLINADTKKPVNRVYVRIEPINGAHLAYKHAGQISLPLVDKHPRIHKQFRDDLISFQVDKPFYVHMAYPVTVKISGGSGNILGLRTRVTVAKAGRNRAANLSAGRASKSNGAFVFEKMPTGKCTFTYGSRRVTKMISGKETITLEAPAAVKFTGKVAIPPKPNLSAANSQRIQTLQQLKNFEKFEDEVNLAIGAMNSKWEALKEDYLERFEVAMESYREQDKLLSQAKQLDSKQREAFRVQLAENRKSLMAAKKATTQEVSESRKSYHAAYKKVIKEVRDDDRSIQDEYSQARSEMYDENKKIRALEQQIRKAVAGVSSYLHHSGHTYQTLAEAESAVMKLEQDVDALDGLVQQIQACVDNCNAARQRFLAQLDAQEKRRFAREQPAAEVPSILGDVEQSRLLLDALKKNAVAEKTKNAVKTVKKRHEQRKKNAAEFARLLKELKKQGGKLPHVDPGDFDKVYRKAADQFAEVLDDPKGKVKDVAKVQAEVKKFLDRNEAVIGDLRRSDRNKEPSYARFDALSRKITDMVSSGMVYAGQDYYKAWEPAQAKIMAAATVRAGVGRRLIAIEKDLEAAKADLDGYRSRLAAAVTDTEALIAKATEIGSDKGADFGAVLDTLDQAWKKSEHMPVFRYGAYQKKIIEAVDAFAANGVLVNYAEAAKRPLVVFDSYLEGGDVNKETKVGKPIFRCKPGPEAYTSVSLKARVIGLPPGKAAVIAVEDDWYRHTCHRDKKTGLHFVNVTLMGDRVSKIRVLGTGKANPPIEYPFFRQVAVN